jgi:(p)ppGpp synthase/HD superfamily hydrolase
MSNIERLDITKPGSLERALEIAARVHANQTDKGGAPYILHPLRLMLSLQDPDERIVALLHDVIEDSRDTPHEVTAECLRGQGFSDVVVTAVVALTKIKSGSWEEPYDDFIARLAPNPLARRVKLADLSDNADLTRIPQPTPKDLERLEKYKRAIAYLERSPVAEAESQSGECQMPTPAE